jgi:hypothetical protein
MAKQDNIKEKAGNLGVAVYTSNKNQFRTLRERWLNLEKRYLGSLKEGSISTKTRVGANLNDAYALVENMIPRLVGSQPQYRYLGREKSDEKPLEAYNEFSNYQWDEADVQNKLKLLVKIGGICGLVGWKMGWKEEGLYQPANEDAKIKVLGHEFKIPWKKIRKLLKKDEIIKNYTFQIIRPYNLIWSTSAEEPNEARVFGHYEIKPIEEWEADGFNMKDFKNKIINAHGDDLDYWHRRGFEIEKLNPEWVSGNVSKIYAEIAELYVRFMEDGAFKYFVVYLVGADEESGSAEVLEVKENPFDKKFTPMGVWRPVKKPGKMHGFGVIEPVKDIIDAENDLFNVSLENLILDVSRPMEYNVSNVINEGALEYKPGTLIPVRRVGETVGVLPTPRLPSIVSLFFDYFRRQIQNVSGITDYQTGAETLRGDKTLGEIQIKTAESNARLKMMLDSLEKEVLAPMGRINLWLNQQYLADDKYILYRILGKKGNVKESKINFKDIDAIKDVIIIPGSSAFIIQKSEYDKWSAFLNQVYLEERSATPVQINKVEAWRRLIQNGMRVQDVETFIPSIAEAEAQNVGDKMAQITDAKQENLDPSTARVLPTDIHEVHIPLHKAAIQNQGSTDGDGNFVQIPPEMLQLLMSHLNEHVSAQGGRTQPEMMSAPPQEMPKGDFQPNMAPQNNIPTTR